MSFVRKGTFSVAFVLSHPTPKIGIVNPQVSVVYSYLQTWQYLSARV